MLSELLPGHVERLFERYRTRGDAAALGVVFDRVAPELAALAARLAPSRASAHDLLQATFLAAMESAASWDPARRLMPWLVGILVREARLARRREARELDPARLSERSGEDPERAAEARELFRAVEGALADVPPRYREVLALHLGAQRTPAEIARELGRSSGAVRVQLHRGLAHLRRALPAGFAAAGALATISPRALADVRAQLMARAAAAGGPLGAGPLVGTGITGGVVLKKVALAGLVVLVVGGGLWLRRAPDGREDPPAARPVDVVLAAPAPADESRAADPAPRREQPQRPTGSVPTAPHGLAPAVGGITGRLVEADGTPLPDTLVELCALPAELLAVDVAAALAGASPTAAPAFTRARTDAEGRFTLAGAQRRALHALALDPGGPRASLRILEQSMALEEGTDLGDVVLAQAGALAGRVVDEAGQPVAGARVRVAPLPEAVLELGLHRWRPESVLVAGGDRRGPPAALALPAWVHALAARLPIPSATTDADGRFVLAAPAGVEATLVADDPRFEPAVRGELVAAAGIERDLGALVLRAGRSATVRVLAPDGAALAGVQVLAGTLERRGALAVCVSPASAEGNGLHRCAGLGGGPFVVAVRGDESAWQVAGPFEGAGPHEVRLAPPHELVLDVRDEAGNAVPGLSVATQALDALGRREETAFLAPLEARALRALDATTYALVGVPQGRHRLFARAPGRAVLVSEVVAGGGAETVRLVLAPGGGLAVRVVDDESGAPLSGATLRVRVGRQGRFLSIATASTDDEGRARLDRVVVAERDELQLQVELDGYARAGARLAAEDVGEVTLRLARPAVLAGRLLMEGESPGRPFLVALRPLEEALCEAGNLPLLALTGADGRFRLSGLTAGPYRVMVGERFLAGDPLVSLLGGRLGEHFDLDKGILEKRLHQGVVTLAAGSVTQLELELAPAAPGAAAHLSGRVVRAGRAWAGLELELDGEDDREVARTSDARGAFDFGPVAPGRARLKVEDVLRGRTVLRAELELQPGERRVLELAFDPLAVDVRLVGPEGPLGGVELVLTPTSSVYAGGAVTVRTDASGTARVVLPGCGTFAWTARAGEREARGSVSVLSGDPLELRFRPLVALSVTLDLSPELAEEPVVLLSARPLDAGASTVQRSGPIDLSDPRVELQLDGPGRYELLLQGPECRSLPIVVDVPAGGLRGQRLRFETGK